MNSLNRPTTKKSTQPQNSVQLPQKEIQLAQKQVQLPLKTSITSQILSTQPQKKVKMYKYMYALSEPCSS